MSLVISIPYRDGILLVSDKRGTQHNEINDDVEKVISVGRFTAVASTGTPLCGVRDDDTNQWKYDFDASESLRKSLKNAKPNGSLRTVSRAIEKALTRDFSRFLKTEEGLKFPRESPIFISRIFHYDQSRKLFQFCTIHMHNLGGTPLPVTKISESPNYLDSMGASQHLTELKSSQSEEDQSDLAILRILRDEIYKTQLSEEDAIYAGTELIARTSRKDETVSPTCDIATIRCATGFQRIDSARRAFN